MILPVQDTFIPFVLQSFFILPAVYKNELTLQRRKAFKSLLNSSAGGYLTN
jgi:hypothetical protein